MRQVTPHHGYSGLDILMPQSVDPLPLTSADLGCICIYIDFYRFLCVYLPDVAVSRYQPRRHRHPLSLVRSGQAWCETLPVQCSPAVYCTVLHRTVLG